MPSPKLITVRSPTGGVYRRSDFQTTPPFTALDARDVWPLDTDTGRRRLAVRPGYALQAVTTSAPNLLATLNVAPSETYLRQPMMAYGGTLYRWNGTAWTSVASGISTGRSVQAAPYLQQLFIANDSTPKKYTYSGHSLSDWTATTDGSVPSGCPLICHWAGRMVLAGAAATPHVWNMSRVDDPFSWLFAAGDDGSPVSATDLEGGQIGEPLTALVPHNRDCLIFGTANTLSVLNGNPMVGGRLERVSGVVGPISKFAWCKTPDDWTYMLTRDGLYRMPPGCGAPPHSVSENIIPDTLRGLDGINNEAFLVYDTRWKQIRIHVAGSDPQSWMFDMTDGGFWPESVPADNVLSMHRFDQFETADRSGILTGASGGLYQLDRTQALLTTDPAFVTIGPLRISPSPGVKAMVTEAIATLGPSTDESGTLDLWAAGSAEALEWEPQDRSYQTTIESLVASRRCYPRLAGHALLAKLTQGDTSQHWVFEELALQTMPMGRERNP